MQDTIAHALFICPPSLKFLFIEVPNFSGKYSQATYTVNLNSLSSVCNYYFEDVDKIFKNAFWGPVMCTVYHDEFNFNHSGEDAWEASIVEFINK